MHTDTKPSSVSSANRSEGSCCGHGEPSPADTVKPSAAPERSPAEQRAEPPREAVQDKSTSCCCGNRDL